MATAPDLGYNPTMPVFIRRLVELYGDREFVVTPEHRVTYRDADRLSAQLARTLLTDGCDKGTRVAFVFPSNADWVTVWLAITRIGAVAIPLSTMYRPAEMRQVLEITDAEILITPARLLGRDQVEFVESAVPELLGASSPIRLPALSCLRRVYLAGETEGPSWSTSLNIWETGDRAGRITDDFFFGVEAAVYPADTMLIVSTSGTTAEPKSVLHTHGAWVRHTANNADSTYVPYGERIYAGMPFFWVGGLSLTLGDAMHRGSTVLSLDKPEPAAVTDLIVGEKATRAIMWPNQLERVKERVLAGGYEDREIPAFLKPSASPASQPGRKTSSLGMTETLAAYIVSGPPDHVIPDEYVGAFGFRVPHMQYRVADPVSGETLPDGDEGEICVRGYNLMIGISRKERHEYLDDDGWYHTGDRGKLDGPYVYFTGRIKDLIKSSGANVSPREVEAVLNRADGVLMSVVVGLPDPARQEIIGAVVVPRLGIELDAGSLVSHCREFLSAYKVPRRIAVVADSELPVGATGKTKVAEIRDLIIARGINV